MSDQLMEVPTGYTRSGSKSFARIMMAAAFLLCVMLGMNIFIGTLAEGSKENYPDGFSDGRYAWSGGRRCRLLFG